MFRTVLHAAIAAIVLSAAPAFAGDASSGSVTIGAIELHGGFARATLPHAPVGSAFFTLTNTGATDDRLVSISSPSADVAQLHEMNMVGDVMKMRELPDGLPVPAGQTVTLEPSGLHIMLMGLKDALVEGQSLHLTLNFATAGSVEVDLPVLGVAADAPMQMQH